MDQHTWDTVDRLKDWLDDNNPAHEQTHRTMRVLKLAEEVGEVAQAVMGATTYNPAKAPATPGRTSRRNSAMS
ncbi:hypothetical protein GCM10010315_60210 [Streptomyces luteosporeus]|uniref:NTP pyrophosphohydrolase MazG putative catalytic core domain-containing protein n=1 Tax=Streptomyces luteosporeus TaxID=173856 RepID=A0ABN3U9T2_9ACTN